MGEDISLIERYLDVCRERTAITEALGIENNVVRFIIPARIDFSITQEDIQEVYGMNEFKADLEAKTPYAQIKRNLIDKIEGLARERLSDLNLKSEGFHITTKEMPNVETAKWFRTTPSQILNYYKKELEELGEMEDEEKTDLANSVVGTNTSAINP